jgi:hypothetical protein
MQPFPAALSIPFPRFRMLSIGQGDSLEELSTTILPDGAVTSVPGVGFFQLNKTSVAVVSPPDVVEALDGGRWLLVGGSIGGSQSWASTLLIGNTSGGTDPTITFGDELTFNLSEPLSPGDTAKLVPDALGNLFYSVAGDNMYQFGNAGITWYGDGSGEQFTLEYATTSALSTGGSVTLIAQSTSGTKGGSFSLVSGDASGNGGTGGDQGRTAGDATGGSGTRVGGSVYDVVGSGASHDGNYWFGKTALPADANFRSMGVGRLHADASAEPTATPAAGQNLEWYQSSALKNWTPGGLQTDITHRYGGTTVGTSKKIVQVENAATIATTSSGTVASFALPDNCTADVEVVVTARAAGGAARGSWRREASAYRNGGGALLQGTVTDVHTKTSVGTVTIDVTGNNVIVTAANEGEVNAVQFWATMTITYFVSTT